MSDLHTRIAELESELVAARRRAEHFERQHKELTTVIQHIIDVAWIDEDEELEYELTAAGRRVAKHEKENRELG